MSSGKASRLETVRLSGRRRHLGKARCPGGIRRSGEGRRSECDTSGVKSSLLRNLA
ncbi:hypothetical protein HMPREF0972_00716 [Actinomyces sp. oral taxon 848 str. F0332]|nr:hypothetical protein HMPREF0972_00716 [Actinomyces sp. oral taxon 848 str. F0332]